MAEEIDAWQEITEKVNEWKENHPDLTQDQQDDFNYAVRQLKKGETANATRRKRIKVSIEEAFDELPDSPFATSSIPKWATETMIRNRDIIIATASKTLADAWDGCPALQIVMTAHGKSGGGFFTEGTTFGQRDETAWRNMLNKMFQGTDTYGRTWDGEFDPESTEAQVGQVKPKKATKKTTKKTK